MLNFILQFSGHDYVVCVVFSMCVSGGVFVLQVIYVDSCLVFSIVSWFVVSSWIISFGS